MAEENKKEYVPIYYDSPEKAYRESVTSPEADAFRASFSATEKCVGDIQAALMHSRVAAGKFSSTDFIESLTDKHGKDRVEYVLASYIRSRENESAYFSDEVKSWAHGIRISDSYMIANTILIAGGDDMVNALAEEMRVRDAEAAYIAAKEGDTSPITENTPEEKTEEPAAAENVPATETAPAIEPEIPVNGDVVKNEDGSVTVRMPEDAVIRRYQTSAVLCMPRNRGYDMFRYMVDIKAYRENGDGTVSVTMCNNEGHVLTIRRRGQEVKLYADKLYDVFAGAGIADYIPQKYSIEIPADAVQGNYPNMIRCKFPDDSTYSGQHVVVPSIFKDEILSDDTKVVFSVPDYMNFSVRNKEGDDMLIPVSDVAREVNGGTYKKKTRWTHMTLPREAMLHVYDKHTLFRMPAEGSYRGFIYYLPNGMAPMDKDGSIKVRIPEERTIEIRNGQTGEKQTLTTLQWSNLVSGKTASDYVVKRDDKVYTGDREFLDRAEKIRSVMPSEMLSEASWIPVRVREGKNSDGGDARWQKFAVAPDPARPASEALYRNIGTDFDTAVRAGEEAGATVMGFCFSDGDDVVCLELDGCLDSTGAPATDKAKDIVESFDGTYIEKSVSGRGLHVFGKMSDPKVSALSKDGEVEMFSGSGYVAVTGDVVKSPKELAPLDEGIKKEFMDKNFDGAAPVPELNDADKKILERALSGQSGQDFRVLYEGGNTRGGKEFCDMSLAMRISCAAEGDVGTVERIYNSSQRDSVSPETLTHLAKRAVNGTRDSVKRAQKAADKAEGKTPAAPAKTSDEREK